MKTIAAVVPATKTKHMEGLGRLPSPSERADNKYSLATPDNTRYLQHNPIASQVLRTYSQRVKHVCVKAAQG